MLRKEYTTEEIMQGLMSNNPAIYRYLDAVYRPKVTKYVRRNSGTHEDGEEVYQDVIYEIYLNIEQGKFKANKGKFEAYFMTITRRRWIDKIRKKNSLIDTTPLDIFDRQVSDTDLAEEVEKDVYNEKVHAMRGYILQLNEDERQLIDLYYFAEKSVEATAKQTGMTYDYARQKLHRTRKKLRDMMANDPIFGTSSF